MIAAWRLHTWRNLVRRTSIRQFLSPAIFVILLIAAFVIDPMIALFVAVIAPLSAALCWIVTPYLLGRQYRSYKGFQELQEVELFDDRLEFRSVDGTSILPWSKVFGWRQNAKLVLIYKAPFLYHLIPKSIAQAGFDVELLVGQLAKHVGPER